MCIERYGGSPTDHHGVEKFLQLSGLHHSIVTHTLVITLVPRTYCGTRCTAVQCIVLHIDDNYHVLAMFDSFLLSKKECAVKQDSISC